MKNTKYIFGILLLSIALLGLNVGSVFAQTSTQTGSIQEPVSDAIPITQAESQSTAYSSVISKYCVDITSKATSTGSALMTAGHIMLGVTPDTAQVISGIGKSAFKNIYDCDKTAYENISKAAGFSYDFLGNKVLQIILWIISTMVNVGIWLLRFSSWLMGLMIGQGSFINNALVQEAWPFIQGLANLGFIFALLYIAFATTLRLESVSTSVQRLLPKLLIGALLVNFSLIIGGLLIDVSRVFMAVEITVMGSSADQNTNITPANLGAKLLRSAGIYNDVFTEGTGLFFNQDTDASGKAIGVAVSNKATSWNSIFSAIQTLIFVYALAIGMMVIALGLFWRYIMLLLLLIVSPGIYLALALPQTKKWFDKWWSEFLKWIMYGPIMLFILILIIRVQAINPVQAVAGDTITPVYQNIIRLIVTIALMMVAAGIAKGSSGAFANSFMGMVNKTGAWARKNPKKAFIAATGGLGLPVVAAVGAGQMAVTGARRQIGDFTSTAGKNLKNNKTIKSVGENFGYGIRDKNGNLLPGKSTAGSSAAKSIFSRFNPNSEEAARYKAMALTDKDKKGFQTNEDFLPVNLSKGHVANALAEKEGNIDFIIENGSQAQRNAIVGNKDYIASLKPEQMKKLQKKILSSVYTPEVKAQAAIPGPMGTGKEAVTAKAARGISDKDKTQLLDKIASTVESIKK